MNILAQETISAAPYLAIIGQIVMWFGLIIVLSIIKGWIVQGTSIAISEWLMKNSSNDIRERVCRWLGDKEQILDYLDRIDKSMGNDTKGK